MKFMLYLDSRVDASMISRIARDTDVIPTLYLDEFVVALHDNMTSSVC